MTKMTKMMWRQQKSQLTPNAEVDCSDAFVVVQLAAFVVFLVELAAFVAVAAVAAFPLVAAFAAVAAVAALAVEYAVNEDHISNGMNNGWVKVSGKKINKKTFSS